jgi:peptide/nickel transport system ATP-binding protein
VAEVLLEVRNLRTEFAVNGARFAAVDGVSFSVAPASTLGIVGESGCGKSVTALTIMRLVADPPGRVAGGEILFRGQNLLSLPEKQMQQVRGNKISMVFQEPMTSLNPVFTVGNQIGEVVRLHQGATRKVARGKAMEMLSQVGIPGPERCVDAYPHQLSGGMRQRVMIAMALACDPDLLIADEPTTALDMTIQAQILDLIRKLQAERHMAMILITHDLGVVAETCSEVAVMYAGRIVEHAPVKQLFAHPAHPYTAGLMRSVPSFEDAGDAAASSGRRRLAAIPGTVPDLRHRPTGCAFRDRCERAVDVCSTVDPPLEVKRDGQRAACHNPVPLS